jgi:hypothetical protein
MRTTTRRKVVTTAGSFACWSEGACCDAAVGAAYFSGVRFGVRI